MRYAAFSAYICFIQLKHYSHPYHAISVSIHEVRSEGSVVVTEDNKLLSPNTFASRSTQSLPRLITGFAFKLPFICKKKKASCLS